LELRRVGEKEGGREGGKGETFALQEQEKGEERDEIE